MNNILVIIGVVIAIIGLFALNYSVIVEDEYLGGLVKDRDVERPYMRMGTPLIIVGIALVIVGIVIRPDNKFIRSS